MEPRLEQADEALGGVVQQLADVLSSLNKPKE
jgi:hypothetical protein